MNKKLIIAILGLLAFTQSVSASLINEMQTCQALIEFVDYKLNDAPDSYAKEDVKLVRKAIKAYDEYIQDEIVTPGLIQFNGGDKGKAKDMQKQIDAYKETLVKGFKQRYSAPGIKTDQAVAMNNCAKKAVPEGEDLELLKKAVPLMVKLAQTK